MVEAGCRASRQPSVILSVVEHEAESLSRYYPLALLHLATPRLTLTPMTDADAASAMDLVVTGIHDPATMPFLVPWTDAPLEQLVADTLRFWWSVRASSRPERWRVLFAVRCAGTLVGLQELGADDFAVTRTVNTGSWLGRDHQGVGLGTEMRSGVLQFAFDHLGATRADSGAFLDNPASLAVSRKLGYRQDGTRVVQRRPGERAIEQRLTLAAAHFRRPDWLLQVRGLPGCRHDFGVPDG
jgi:RimJ/RimL family protein N-acetyltransferase